MTQSFFTFSLWLVSLIGTLRMDSQTRHIGAIRTQDLTLIMPILLSLCVCLNWVRARNGWEPSAPGDSNGSNKECTYLDQENTGELGKNSWKQFQSGPLRREGGSQELDEKTKQYTLSSMSAPSTPSREGPLKSKRMVHLEMVTKDAFVFFCSLPPTSCFFRGHWLGQKWEFLV